jgi:hypothetical protein
LNEFHGAWPRPSQLLEGAGTLQDVWGDLSERVKELEDGDAWEHHLGALLACQVCNNFIAHDALLCCVKQLCCCQGGFEMQGSTRSHVTLHLSQPSHTPAPRAQVLVPEVEDEAYDARIEAFAMCQLAASEVRVRNAVADALEVLARQHGAAVWVRCQDAICSSIRDNYVRLCIWLSARRRQRHHCHMRSAVARLLAGARVDADQHALSQSGTMPECR